MVKVQTQWGVVGSSRVIKTNFVSFNSSIRLRVKDVDAIDFSSSIK